MTLMMLMSIANVVLVLLVFVLYLQYRSLKYRFDFAVSEYRCADSHIEKNKRKADAYFQAISIIEKERDNYRLLYQDQSLGHDNAQRLMMHIISELHKELHKLGVTFKLPEIIQAVRGSFEESHGAEASKKKVEEVQSKAKRDLDEVWETTKETD